MKDKKLIQSAVKTVKDCFTDVSFIKEIRKVALPKDSSPDYIFHLVTPFRQNKICVEIGSNGQPRYARMLINKLNLLDGDKRAYWIYVAPFISEKTGQMLRSSGIGFADFAGNCHISFDGIHIQKEGKKNPFLTKRQFKSLFRLKASRVLRVLLANPNRYWKLEKLANEAKVSTGHVFNVKEELLNREWAEFDNRGIKLKEPESLLQEWCKNYQIEEKQCLSFYSLLSPTQFEDRIKTVCSNLKVRYALSGFAGAFRLAPFVRYHRVHFYLENKIDAVAGQMDLKSVTSGENVIMIKPLDDGIFSGMQEIEGMQVVSPIQLYLDLKVSTDRGKEAADFIFSEVIEPRWKKTK